MKYTSYEFLESQLHSLSYRFGAECEKAIDNANGQNPELPPAYDYLKPYICSHASLEPRRWMLKNGTIRVALQCPICGEKEANGVKNADYPDKDSYPFLNEAKLQKTTDLYWEIRQELYLKRQSYLADYHDGNLRTQRQEYTEYIRTSPIWQSKRERVFRRDGYMCQACLTNPAAQVHHLTYNHLFDEPLFELVSICTLCHKKLHPHKEGTDG